MSSIGGCLLRRVFIIFYHCLIFAFIPALACADGIEGYLDYNYSGLTSETKLAQGETTSIKTNTFIQQYNATLTRTIYPNLRLLANGIFEKDITKANIDGDETTSKTTIVRPLLDLTLKTPFYLAGVNYNRRETKNESSGVPSQTNVNEQYSALFGWLPVGFPSVDVRYTRTNTFDKSRLVQDTKDDFAQVSSNYEPMKNLLLRYQGTYRDTNDKLNQIETKELSNNGKINYDGTFFKDRVTVSTSYDITRRVTDITTAGTGEVSFPLLRFAGLFLLDNTNTPTRNTLNPTPFLIDGDKVGTGGNLIDLGFARTLAGDTNQRNIGLNFGSIVELNALRVWVDRTLQGTTPNSFTWSVFISPDNLNWVSAAINSVTFGPFENRFEIRIANVQTQYIKVVARPIAVVPQPDANQIFVTELEALIFRPVGDVKGETTTTTQIFNLYTKARILDNPYLFYDLSYYFVKSRGLISTLTSTLANGLNVSHRFSDIFTGTSRVAREDGRETRGTVSAYTYTAALRAVPYRTLSHSITFNGRDETNPDGNLRRNTVSLFNTADLYKGVSMFAGGGYSLSTLETGRRETGTSVNFGSSIIPNDKITLTLNFTSSTTEDTGADLPATSTVTTREDITIAYHPVQTVYISASLSKLKQNDKKDTLKNYSIDWSPFPGGALQFTFSYNENLRTEDNSIDKVIRPSVRWNITSRSFLDASYLIVKSESDVQKVDTKIFNVHLRIPF